MATSGISGRVPEIAPRIIGVGFAAAAVFNTAVVLPRSRTILRQYAEGAWLPPYRTVLRTLVPAAPAVIAGVVAFEAAVAYHLLRGRRTNGALRWTQAFTMGLLPVLVWPYWPPNLVYSVAVELLLRRRA